MRIRLNVAALRQLTLGEAAWRFGLGAIITAVAGLVAERWGPSVGGLFLAFPAILPASLTLVASHEEKQKAQDGQDGQCRGRLLAALDAKGATLGAAALIGFAFTTHHLALRGGVVMTLATATTAWLLIAFALWWLRRRLA